MPDWNYWGNAGRQFGQGASFGTSDSAEAAMRALLTGDMHNFLANKARIQQQIERERQQWADQNPKAAMGADIAGALVPGVAGALIPGGQAATLGTLGRVGQIARVMDAPLERAVARVAPRALQAAQNSKLGRLAVGLGDEMLTGAAQSAGATDVGGDIGEKIREDALGNMLGSLGVRGTTESINPARLAVKKLVKGRK